MVSFEEIQAVYYIVAAIGVLVASIYYVYRFHAELEHAAVGIKREDANELVKQIVSKYENSITKDGGSWGYTFGEIYSLKTLTPKQRFLELYEKVKKELEDLGIVFRY